MRTALTLGYPHGGGAPELACSPTLGIEEQKAALKAARSAGSHPRFGLLEIWTSGEGVTKRAKLDKPATVKTVEPVKAAQPSAPSKTPKV